MYRYIFVCTYIFICIYIYTCTIHIYGNMHTWLATSFSKTGCDEWCYNAFRQRDYIRPYTYTHILYTFTHTNRYAWLTIRLNTTGCDKWRQEGGRQQDLFVTLSFQPYSPYRCLPGMYVCIWRYVNSHMYISSAKNVFANRIFLSLLVLHLILYIDVFQVFMYLYIHTYIHTNVQTYMHTYIRLCIRANMYLYK